MRTLVLKFVVVTCITAWAAACGSKPSSNPNPAAPTGANSLSLVTTGDLGGGQGVKPLSGATIALANPPVSKTTGEDGVAVFSDLQSNVYKASIHRFGFVDKTVTVDLISSMKVTETLTPKTDVGYSAMSTVSNGASVSSVTWPAANLFVQGPLRLLEAYNLDDLIVGVSFHGPGALPVGSGELNSLVLTKTSFGDGSFETQLLDWHPEVTCFGGSCSVYTSITSVSVTLLKKNAAGLGTTTIVPAQEYQLASPITLTRK